MDTRLKERLVGAVALVLIVVLVVPELLTGPRRASPPVAAEGPAQVRTVVVDLAQSEAGAAPRPAGEAAPVLAPVAAPAAADTALPPVADGAAAAPPPLSAAPPVRGAAPPAPAPVATVEEAAKPAAKADVARTELQKNDAQKAESSKPAIAKAAPEVAKAPVAEPAKPAAAEPAKPPPAEPQKAAAHAPKPPVAAGEGWVVQLGSFASRDNGEKLAKLLHGKGYRAFVSEFRGNGRILYRVRVGPEQDRSRAEAIAARLSRDGYKGSVAPH